MSEEKEKKDKSRLCFADQQHLISILVDGICERKTARELRKLADDFFAEIDRTVSLPTYHTYLNKAKDIFNTPYETCRNKNKINAMHRLDTLYKRSIKNKDFSVALKIEKELTLLRGVYKDLDEGDKEQTINIVFKDAEKKED